MYISWRDSPVLMPQLQLVSVKRVTVTSQQTVTVSANISSDQLRVWHDYKGFILTPGHSAHLYWPHTHLYWLYTHLHWPHTHHLHWLHTHLHWPHTHLQWPHTHLYWLHTHLHWPHCLCCLVLFSVIVISNTFTICPLHHHDNVIVRVYPVHLTYLELCQVAADSQTKSTDLGRESAIIHTHHCHLVLLNLKVDTHFTMLQRVESSVQFNNNKTISMAPTVVKLLKSRWWNSKLWC